MSVVLYTKPGCGPCRATKAALMAKGLPFDEIDVSQDAEAFEFVSNTLGYRGVPVVYVDAGQHWTGFDPARIDAIVNRDPSLG